MSELPLRRGPKPDFAYLHIEDFDPKITPDLRKLDNLMEEILNHTTEIIGQRSASIQKILSGITQGIDAIKYDQISLGSVLKALLGAFKTTHRAILLLLSYQDKEPELGFEAMSLAREQVEKIFKISLLLDHPDLWVPLFLKYSWKRYYLDYLLKLEELEKLHEKYVTETSPNLLNDMRKSNGTTDDEVIAVECEFYYGEEFPKDLKKFSKSKIANFPTPGRAVKKIKNQTMIPFLRRWQKEYDHLCGYSHAGIEKLAAQALNEKSDIFRREELENIRKSMLEKEIQTAVFTSYIAFASACSEICSWLKGDELLEKRLKEFWGKLCEASLLARVFWNLRGKQLLNGETPS